MYELLHLVVIYYKFTFHLQHTSNTILVLQRWYLKQVKRKHFAPNRKLMSSYIDSFTYEIETTDK